MDFPWIRTTSGLVPPCICFAQTPIEMKSSKCLRWVIRQHQDGTQERRKEQEGNSAKHLITAVPGNLNLSKMIVSSPCLIATDGCWPVMHDNACVSHCSLPGLIPVSFHCRWWTQSPDHARGVWASYGGWGGLEKPLVDIKWLGRR